MSPRKRFSIFHDANCDQSRAAHKSGGHHRLLRSRVDRVYLLNRIFPFRRSLTFQQASTIGDLVRFADPVVPFQHPLLNFGLKVASFEIGHRSSLWFGQWDWSSLNPNRVSLHRLRECGSDRSTGPCNFRFANGPRSMDAATTRHRPR